MNISVAFKIGDLGNPQFTGVRTGHHPDGHARYQITLGDEDAHPNCYAHLSLEEAAQISEAWTRLARQLLDYEKALSGIPGEPT